MDIPAICEAWDKGVSLAEVARRAGCSRDGVRKVLRRLGLDPAVRRAAIETSETARAVRVATKEHCRQVSEHTALVVRHEQATARQVEAVQALQTLLADYPEAAELAGLDGQVMGLAARTSARTMVAASHGAEALEARLRRLRAESEKAAAEDRADPDRQVDPERCKVHEPEIAALLKALKMVAESTRESLETYRLARGMAATLVDHPDMSGGPSVTVNIGEQDAGPMTPEALASAIRLLPKAEQAMYLEAAQAAMGKAGAIEVSASQVPAIRAPKVKEPRDPKANPFAPKPK